MEVLDPCESCGRLCDYAACAYWGTCDDCWFNFPTRMMITGEARSYTPAVSYQSAPKEEDDPELLEILP